MAFKESYLVPKSEYERLTKVQLIDEPADVQLKKLDHAYRFQTKVTTIPPTLGQERKEHVLEAIKDDSKRMLATKILKFIRKKGGGTIKWDENFKLMVDDFKLSWLDARDAFRYLVGEIEDRDFVAYPLYEKLVELKAPSYMIAFYDKPISKPGVSKPTEKDWPWLAYTPEKRRESESEEEEERGRSLSVETRRKRKKAPRFLETRSKRGSTRSGRQWRVYP